MDGGNIQKLSNSSASSRLADKISNSFQTGSLLKNEATRPTITKPKSSNSRATASQSLKHEVRDTSQHAEISRVDGNELDKEELEEAESSPPSSAVVARSQKDIFNSW
jgi:hypothetical protein